MTPTRGMAAVVVLTLVSAAAVAGCGLGPGQESDEKADLAVTRDYGEQELLTADARPADSETVMRFLDRQAEIETRYGGGFVQSIEGVEGGTRDGRSVDWFFYVNGIEAGRGAAEFRVRGGDRVWWDHRDWTAVMRVPAVVGSFPEPFAHGYDGRRWPAAVRCVATGAAAPTCDTAAAQLRDEAVKAPVSAGPGSDSGQLRVLVGPWNAVRKDAAASVLERGPRHSGVFARFGSGGRALSMLGVDGQPRRTLRAGAGLIAAVRPGDGPPTWIVTGTDGAGVEAAIAFLTEEDLKHHYAVVTTGEAGPIPVPIP